MKPRAGLIFGHCLLILPAIILIALSTGLPAKQANADTLKCETCNICGQTASASASSRYPIMRYTPEQIEAENLLLETAPPAYIDHSIARKSQLDTYSEGTSKNLLPLLQYTPYQRDQGYCGNCWVWAGTGCLELALKAQQGITDNRLSIQYFNSNYTGGYGFCCGGDASTFANYYKNTLKKAIPWANTNAAYVDGSSSCGGSTAMPAGSIYTTPNYPISNVTYARIPTYSSLDGVSQDTAIANIKYVLNQNKGIYFGFTLANDTDWNQFFNFWNTQAELYLWPYGYSHNGTYIYGQTGGHAVLCVGYDDTPEGTANDYWMMLNSWGTTAGRPNGLFRVPMYYNYDSYITGYGYSTRWYTVEPTFTSVDSQQKLLGADDGVAGASAGGWFVLDRWTASSTGSLTEIRINCTKSGNVKVGIYADNSGQPGTLLSAVNTSTPVIAGWNTIPISSVSITSGTNYWLAFNSDSDTVGYQNSLGRQRRGMAAVYSSFTFPGTAGVPATNYASWYNVMAGWDYNTQPAPVAPVVTNGNGTSSITNTSATFNGNLTSNGNADTTVHIYWGSSDGGTNAAGWANDINLGVKAIGAFSSPVSDLTTGTTYYYRCYAVNSAGSSWASASASFVAQSSGKLLGADDGVAGASARGWFVLDRWTASSTGSLTEIRINCTKSGNVKVGIYADNSGQPGTLLSAVNTSTPVIAGWNTIPISSVSITSGTNYWLAFNSDSDTVGYQNSLGRQRRGMAAVYSSFTFPGTAGVPATNYESWYNVMAGWGSGIPVSPPPIPVTTSPLTSIYFAWNASPGATKYTLQVNTSQTFDGTSLFNSELPSTSQTVTGVIGGTTYYWHVRAGNDAGWSDWSPTRSILVN